MGKTRADERLNLNENTNRLSASSKGISKGTKLHMQRSSEIKKSMLEISEQSQKEQEEQELRERPEIQKRMYLSLKIEDEEAILKKDLTKQIYKNGILKDDPRIKKILSKLEDIDDFKLTKEEFYELLEDHHEIIHQSMTENFIIPEFEKTKAKIKELYNQCK